MVSQTAATQVGGRWPSASTSALVLALGLSCALPAAAVDLSGSAEIATGSSDIDGTDTTILDQSYRLDLRQVLTEYLQLRFGYNYLDISRDTADDGFDRRDRRPRLELTYQRPRLSGSLALEQQRSSGTGGDLSLDSILGRLSWRATEKIAVNLHLRDETRASDVALFGRDAKSREATLEAVRRSRWWSVGTSFERRELSNDLTGLDTTQDRYEGRLDAAHSFLGGKLALAFDSRISRVERSFDIPAGAVLAEPLPAVEGLSAVDVSPEDGALDATPELIDGELDTPSAPPVDIGGAFTFRNVGVDVGLLRPADQLEITVDAPSDPGLVWRVYHSVDNVLWQEIPDVTVVWDGDLLRYVLHFAQTADRYFKAVNVTVNSAPDVQVTEIRALLTTDSAAALAVDRESTFYQVDTSIRLHPHPRVSAAVTVGTVHDEGQAGFVRQRDYTDDHADAQVQVDLPAHFRVDARYRYLDFEDRIEPSLVRTEETTTGRLGWSPLETLSADLTYTVRDESDESTLLRSTETLRFHVDSELLPGLRLDSQVETATLDEPFFDRKREILSWHELVEAQATANLLVAGGISYQRYDGADGETLYESRDLRLRTTWRATPYLVLGGDWSVNENLDKNTVRQSYNLSYSPGTRLTLNAAYQELEDRDLRTIQTGVGSATYRLNDHFNLFASYTTSSLDEIAGDGRTIKTLRMGIRLFF